MHQPSSPKLTSAGSVNHHPTPDLIIYTESEDSRVAQKSKNNNLTFSKDYREINKYRGEKAISEN